MGTPIDRRTFLRVAGLTLGAGALWRVGPALAEGEGADVNRALRHANGEGVTPFTLVQLSDTHVGYAGVSNPTGVQAFERAVQLVNRLPEPPDLILFTGDLTHDTEAADEHAARMRTFREIAGRLRVKAQHLVPGENDAARDGGALFREALGPTHHAFDHKGVHFVALDNVSGGPEVGAAQREWLRQDLSRFPPTAPIVVFTHRPLFDLMPAWDWSTRDGAQVLALLAPFENVTVLYGHIHREDRREIGGARHLAARSLIFGLPDPATAPKKAPATFDPDHPFRNLGLRVVREGPGGATPAAQEVELTLRERSGSEGFAQILRPSSL